MISVAVMGVDPGTKGGIAVLAADGRVAFLRALRPEMPEPDVVEAVRQAAIALRREGATTCFFEKVQHMTGDGAQGSHTFGYVKGLLRGCVLTNGISIKDVYPAMWQARLDCLSRGNKNVTKKRAAELFPTVKMTHAVADALLIAEYGRRCLGF